MLGVIMQQFNTLSSKPLRASFLSSISGISAVLWNRLANSSSPFLRHEFLYALEHSGSTSSATGWQPSHLLVVQETDDPGKEQILAALPLFEKSNSYGEYVFDWAWADAFQRNGLAYYPKLLTAIPFTPSTSARLLCEPNLTESQKGNVMEFVVATLKNHALQNGFSSWHILFPNQQQSDSLGELGLLHRQGCQFHWFNRNYKNFDDFLQTFISRKRKNLRKERDAVSQQGITFRHFSGTEIDEQLWDKFYGFYQHTYQVRGQKGYLTREFFSQIAASMPENLLLIMALQDRNYIAGALSFRDAEKLYGRYWGGLYDLPFLHFETCYYQGIEYCIANNLKSFDSGAQGEHKIQRGFEPIATHSNHWIADPRFASAIADYLRREAVHMERYRLEAQSLLPFKTELD